MSWKREIPPGVEEQKLASEAMHDEGSEAWPHDVRRQVRGGILAQRFALWSVKDFTDLCSSWKVPG